MLFKYMRNGLVKFYRKFLIDKIKFDCVFVGKYLDFRVEGAIGFFCKKYLSILGSIPTKILRIDQLWSSII